MRPIFDVLPMLVLFPVLLLSACGSDSPNESAPSSVPTQISDAEFTTTTSGLKFSDLAVGTGSQAQAGLVAVVHYTGWLTNDKKFDSSRDRGEPFSFTLGLGQVIAGWDEGVATMKVGGKRQLVIPPALAYSNREIGEIPANSTLIFEIELLELR